MRIERDAAEMVVDAPFPYCVGMSVEQDPSLDFAGGLFRSDHVIARFFRKRPVDKSLVDAQLHRHDKESHDHKDHRKNGHEEERRDGRQHERDREIDPAEERSWMHVEAVQRHVVASALVLELLRHVLAGQFFTLRTRIALGKVLANIRDFFLHVFCRFVFLFDDFR